GGGGGGGGRRWSPRMAVTRRRRMGGRTAAAEHARASRARRRTCVGCRRVADPQELVRIVREPNGTVSVGRGPGRGAWLCGPPSTRRCVGRAVRRRGLERGLRAPAP